MDISICNGKTILVTGATGLIGQALVKSLLKKYHNSKVIGVVRNEEKAKEIFLEYMGANLEFIVSDISTLKTQHLGVNYIIHGASQTASKAFVNEPVETIMTAVNGTTNMLEFARMNPVDSFVYLSSMEVYGTPERDERIDELYSAGINTMNIRACYPESKRICENLCASYSSEYGVPARVVRLTQTFGPGVQYDDGRVFAEFARCVIENRNIILNTKGDTKRNYLYIEDAVSAILTVLCHGKDGEAYNAANEETYCSIYEMACLVAEKCASGKISVEVNEAKDISKFGYAPTLYMNLDTSKLKALGWNPTTNLQNMYKNMISYMIKTRGGN